MTQLIIDVGPAPNDGLGDPIRTAFQKTNANFTELYNQAGGTISNQAGGEFSADGSAVHLNSGNSVDAEVAKPSEGAVLAGISNIGIMSGRKDISDNDKDDPLVLSLADNRSIALEEETQTSDDFNTQKNLIISEVIEIIKSKNLSFELIRL